jgi:hypothetical protein
MVVRIMADHAPAKKPMESIGENCDTKKLAVAAPNK